MKLKQKLSAVNERWKEYALAGSVCVVLLVVLLNLGSIFHVIGEFFGMLSTIIIGIVIAYIINPLAILFQRKIFGKLKKERLAWLISVFLSFVIVLGLLILLMAMLIPQMAGNISDIITNAQAYLSRVGEGGLQISFLPDSINSALNDYIFGKDGLITKAGSIIANNIGTLISATSNAGGKAASWAIGLIMAIYFLLEKERIKSALGKLGQLIMAPIKYIRCQILLSKFHSIFSQYIICEILDSVIVAIVNAVFMIITGLPNALFLSVIAGITNLAPSFGPIIGLAINAFFLILSSPEKIWAFVIFTIILQTLDGYVIKPKLFGGAMNVPGVLILVFIILFGNLLGISGILLAIPLAGIAVYLYTEALIPWLELKKDLKEYKTDERTNTRK